LTRWLTGLGVEENVARIGATGFVVVIVTYFSIVLGELVPKRIGQIGAEAVARRMALPIHDSRSRPNLRASAVQLDRSDPAHLRCRRGFGASSTEEEIHALIEEGQESGVVDEQERAMVRNVFRLDDRQIASLMTPRSSIVYIDLDDGPDENLRKVIESEHSRFPVVRADCVKWSAC